MSNPKQTTAKGPLYYAFSIPASPVTLTAIDPNSRANSTRTFRKNSKGKTAAAKWVVEQQALCRNVYYQDCSIRTVNKRPTKADVAAIHCAHVDIDSIGPQEQLAAEKAAIVTLLQLYATPPTDIVDSGNGIQAFWYLVDALPGTAENIAAIEAINRKLVADLGGDGSCHDVAHLVRLPGSTNYPSKKKRALGRTVCKGRIIVADHDGIENYRLHDLPQGEPEKASASNDNSAPEEIDIPGTVDLSGVDPEFRRLIVAGPKEGERFGDGSRSDYTYAVACSLRRAGFTDGQIICVITDATNAVAAHILDQKQRSPIDQAKRVITRMNEDGVTGFTAEQTFNDEVTQEAQAKQKADGDRTDADMGIPPSSSLELIRMSDVEAENIDFVWPNRLALGKHTIIAGMGGRGKSQILYDTAATISLGRPWPNNEGIAPQGSVILLSAEDDAADMMKPRLVAAGADTERVHRLNAVVEHVSEKNKRKRRFNLLTDLDRLYKVCRELGDVVMIGIDPIGSYIGSKDVDTHNDASLRGALDPVSEMASAAHVAIMSVAHFNKSGAMKSAVDRVMGGAGFVNAPRCALGLIDDPEDKDKRLLLGLKSNLGPLPMGLEMHLELADAGQDHRTGEPIKATHVVWDGTTDMSANEAMAVVTERGTPKLDQATAFLLEMLRDGPRPHGHIKSAARALGIKDKTLRNARDKLGIVADQVPGVPHGGWVWSFPDPVEEPDDF
jgi:hypothetical protein